MDKAFTDGIKIAAAILIAFYALAFVAVRGYGIRYGVKTTRKRFTDERLIAELRREISAWEHRNG